MPAPPLGQPSLTADQITAAYQQAFGRDPYGREMSSELENANKYDASGILNSIAARTNNIPGSGDPGTAQWMGINNGNPNVGSLSMLTNYVPYAQLAQMRIAPQPMMPRYVAPMSTVAQQPTTSTGYGLGYADSILRRKANPWGGV